MNAANIPNWREWLFSAKAFVAGMLALYLALYLSLPNPYWALASVYIVSHPLSGATRSKGMYRVWGTLLGGAASVAFVPALVDAPELLCIVMSCWTGTMLYLSLLDRTPRSYVFMLAAFTTPLISLPVLMHPETIFDVVLARSEEIVLGIVCASVINTVVFPSRVGPVLSRQMGELMNAAAEWACGLLAIREPFANTHAQRDRLLADVMALEAPMRQLSYDASHYRQSEHVREIRLRLAMLIPQVSALFDPMYALLESENPRALELRALTGRFAAWIAGGNADSGDTPDRLRREAADLAARLPAERKVDDVLVSNALLRLGELVDIWEDCANLLQAFKDRDVLDASALRYRRGQKIGTALHLDYGLLLLSAVSVSAAMLVACLLWIALGWNAGAGGVTIAVLSCCFFAAADNPAPMFSRFQFWATICVAFSTVYLFAILPHIHGYFGLAAVLAVPLIYAGAFAGRQEFNMSVLLFTSLSITDIQLNNAYNADFESFANSSLATMLGLIFAMTWATVARPFGTEMAASRLAHAGWRDLVELASFDVLGSHAAAAARMVDRTSQLLPRLGLIKNEALARIDGMRELLIGLRILDLLRQRETLPAFQKTYITSVLGAVAAHYARCNASGRPLEPLLSLRSQLDNSIRGLLLSDDDAVQALVGLRLAMFSRALTHDLPGAPDPFPVSLTRTHS